MTISRILTLSVMTSVLATSTGFMPSSAIAAENSPAKPQQGVVPTTESSCGLLILNGTATETKPYPALHVLNASSIKMPKIDANVLAVSCNRNSVIPAVGDDRVFKAQPKPFILSDGVRSGTLTLEKGKYKYAVSGGVLTKDERASVDARLSQMQRDSVALAKKKSGSSKVVGCIAGGLLTGFAAALLAPKRDRGAAAVIGFAAGCGAGWAFAKSWSQKDKDGLDQASQEAFDSPSGQMGWQAPESGQQVRFQSASAGERNQDVEFQHLDTVEAPPEGSRVISKPFRTVGMVALRSSPDNTSADNIIGRFNTSQTVEIVGLTPDSRWAMVGEDGVIVGYAVREGFAELGQSLRQVHTDRHLIDVPNSAKPAVASRRSVASRKAGRRATAPAMLAQIAPPPAQGQIRTTQVRATTQCKSLVAATGQQQNTRTGCQLPGGKWGIA